MKSILLLIFSCVLSQRASAGVNDYFIYDQANRFQLDTLNGIVSVKVINYYAFSDPGLVITLDEERKKNQEKVLQPESLVDVRISSTKGTEYLYIADPILNATLQLKRNSLWIIDAEILKVLDGNIEKKRAFIAMKRTRAFKFYEHPTEILSGTSTNLLLGLMEIGKEDFGKDFRGLMCYLESDLSDFERNSSGNLRNRFFIDYDSIFRARSPSSFYVAREIGTSQRYTVKNGKVQSCQGENKLIQALHKKRASDSFK
ncbi:hypothetical protein [Pontiella sp.]|uniref:hypothetical protein n=1 Tax=Pontiella sp. TaxID=2837462 RepID=UPI00356172F8